MQRGDAFTVFRIDFRAGLDQHIQCFQIIAIHGPVQGCRAIGLRSIDIGLLLQQCANGGFIPPHHRVRNIATTAGKG